MKKHRASCAVLGVTLVCALWAAPAQAFGRKKTDFGTLPLMEGWQVGQISAPDAEYCAMVGRYDKYASLVIARNVDGYGSLALDFGEALFQAGGTYDITLSPDQGKTRRVKASAASDRSVVVQIGRSDGLLREVSRSTRLLAELPDFDVTFDMQNAGAAVEDMGACAARLAGGNLAVRFQDAEGDAPDSAAAQVFEFSDTPPDVAADGGAARDDKICWGQDKYLKASLVSSQAKVVALSEKQARQQETEKALEEKETAYAERIAALEAERDALKAALARQPEVAAVKEQDIVWKQVDAAVVESTVVEKPPVPVRAAVAVSGGYYAQLGSFKAEADVHKHWKRIVKKHPHLLENVDYQSEGVDLGTKGKWFRLRTGSLSRAEADKICDSINAGAKQGCIVRQ